METRVECPVCHTGLILKGSGWGFCDYCVCEITLRQDKVKQVKCNATSDKNNQRHGE